MESAGQGFLLEKKGNIAYITFNRPEKLNAFRQKGYELFLLFLLDNHFCV